VYLSGRFCFSILSFRSFIFRLLTIVFICFEVHRVSENGRVSGTSLDVIVLFLSPMVYWSFYFLSKTCSEWILSDYLLYLCMYLCCHL